MDRPRWLYGTGAVATVVAAGGIAFFGGSSSEDKGFVSRPAEQATTSGAPLLVAPVHNEPPITISPTATPRVVIAEPTPYDGPVSKFAISGVSFGIEVVGINAKNELEDPHDPTKVGWYANYDRPGYKGNAVFAAHVNYKNLPKGPFYDLAKMKEGDVVEIEMGNGVKYKYEFVSKKRYKSNQMDMGKIVWPDKPEGEEWITMITCGGTLVVTNSDGTGYYTDRDVVVAKRIK